MLFMLLFFAGEGMTSILFEELRVMIGLAV